MENKEQVYTQGGGEKWTDYEDLMNDLKEHYNIGESVEVWEADKVELKHFHYIYAKDLIDAMQTRAMDDCGEIAEEYLNDLEDWKKAELEQHIAEWFDKNSKINVYGVENEKKIMVIVE